MSHQVTDAQKMCNDECMPVRRSIVSVLLAAIAMCATSVAAAADAPHDSAAPAKTSSDIATPAAAPAAVAASAPGNQIWECTTNGLRTFSNNPCGAKSSIRQLNPINVMEPAPIYRATHAYAPAVAPPAPSSMNYSYSPQDGGDDTYQDNTNSAYPGYIVVSHVHRFRPHAAAPPHHPHPHHP